MKQLNMNGIKIMSKKQELHFYEGMFAIQICCILIFSILFILSMVCFIMNHNLFYVPIGILGGCFIIVLAIYLFGIKFLKKIMVDKTGITIIHYKNDVHYDVDKIIGLNIDNAKLADVIFTNDFFCWIIGLRYLKVQMNDSQEVLLLTTKKNSSYIKEILKK